MFAQIYNSDFAIQDERDVVLYLNGESVLSWCGPSFRPVQLVPLVRTDRLGRFHCLGALGGLRRTS